jgi:hypothetical protein
LVPGMLYMPKDRIGIFGQKILPVFKELRSIPCGKFFSCPSP